MIQIRSSAEHGGICWVVSKAEGEIELAVSVYGPGHYGSLC